MKTLNFIFSLLLLNLCIVSCGKSNSKSDVAIDNITAISSDDNFNSSDEIAPAMEEALPPPPPEPPLESKATTTQNTKK